MSPDRNHPRELVAAAEARRRRVFRVMIVAVVLWPVLLVGVRVWWGSVANRRLEVEIDRYHATGEPILVADFIPQSGVPDEENAAVAYDQAFAALDWRTERGTTISFGDLRDSRVCEAYPNDVRVFIEASVEALELLRRGRSLRRVDWAIRLTDPGWDLFHGKLGGLPIRWRT